MFSIDFLMFSIGFIISRLGSEPPTGPTELRIRQTAGLVPVQMPPRLLGAQKTSRAPEHELHGAEVLHAPRLSVQRRSLHTGEVNNIYYMTSYDYMTV